MREEDKHDPSQSPDSPETASFCVLPPIEGERRKEQDRRSAERQGKYDRRRNRCVHCLHFQAEGQTVQGICQFHQVPMASDAFACPNFNPLHSSEGRK